MNNYYQYYPAHPPNPIYQYPYPYPIRNLPPVNPKMFVESAKKMRPLLKDADTLMDHISKSTTFSRKLMAAAQESKSNEVKKMIYDTGIKSKPEIKYTPTGLTITFSNNEGEDCCHLQVSMRWGF